MKAHGNPNQWGPTNWPPEKLIHNDIKEGNNYVCLNEAGNVAGVFYFIQGKNIEPTYKNIFEGKWTGSGTYGDNIVMQNLLKKLGFNYCGTIYVEEDNYPRLAFEKTK